MDPGLRMFGLLRSHPFDTLPHDHPEVTDPGLRVFGLLRSCVVDMVVTGGVNHQRFTTRTSSRRPSAPVTTTW